jgi:hypothetical protein
MPFFKHLARLLWSQERSIVLTHYDRCVVFRIPLTSSELEDMGALVAVTKKGLKEGSLIELIFEKRVPPWELEESRKGLEELK